MTTRNRMIFWTGMGAAALALCTAPAPAEADSRRHIFKPEQNVAGGITRESVPGGIDAPEIDPAGIGLGIALAVGGLALLANRRRSSVM